jgi:exonuclease III
VVVAGDLNARPGAGGHAVLLAAGYADAWAEVHGDVGGFTCCHQLASPGTRLSERIDHLLVRGLAVRDAWTTGADPEARAGARRWPSDHAGVVADLEPSAG